MNDLYGSSTRLRQDASLPRTASGIFDKRELRFAPRSTGRIGLRQRLRPDKMARGDRGVARRAKPGLPRHSLATAGGFGVVPLGFATDSTFVAEAATSAQQVAPPFGRGASLFIYTRQVEKALDRGVAYHIQNLHDTILL